MFTFIVQDFQGNSYISRQRFETKEQVEEKAFDLLDYHFIASIEIVNCKDMICFNSLNPQLN